MLHIQRYKYHSTNTDYKRYYNMYKDDFLYGMEFEIYSLTTKQSFYLGKLLEKLPPHHIEEDGSLDDYGLEIIFHPLPKDELIKLVITLQRFIKLFDCDMDNTGMHITIGARNSEVSFNDLTIRVNRITHILRGLLYNKDLKDIFGRLFNNYCVIPISIVDSGHYNTFSVRNNSAIEFRLPNYKCNIYKVMSFLETISVIFKERITKNLYIKLIDILEVE